MICLKNTEIIVPIVFATFEYVMYPKRVGSSVVEQRTVNPLVVGSIPTLPSYILESKMLACICGGVIEFLMFSGFLMTTIISTIFGTSWYNKKVYKKYIDYKNKHKSCQCECHEHDEEDEQKTNQEKVQEG